MSTYHDLYWLVPKGYFVQSPLVPVRIALPALHRQDRPLIRLHLLDVDPDTRGTLVHRDLFGYECHVGVGDPAVPESYAEQALIWDDDLEAFVGVLNLYTEQMEDELEAATGLGIDSTFYFRVQNGDDVDDDRVTGLEACRVLKVVKHAASGLPEDVTDSQLADLIEGRLADSNTVTWRRVVDSIYADAVLMPAAALFDPLSVSFTELAGTATPSDDTDAGVVASGVVGWMGSRFLIRARFAGTVEVRGYNTGGLDFRRAGDDSHVYRGGEPDGGGAADQDVWYLDISSPPQRIHLNAASAFARTAVDYQLEFLADAGATLTLGFTTVDGLSSGSGGGTLTFMAAVAVPGDQVLHQSSEAVAAHTGTLDETTQATVAVPPMGLNDRLRVALTYSRPAAQVADALILVRHNGNLAYRQRVGLLRGGVIDLPVVSNRGAFDSQVLAPDSESDYAVGTSAEATNADSSLTVAFVLENVADTLTLEALTVTKIPKP